MSGRVEAAGGTRALQRPSVMRHVLLASMIGTIIEWYDFLIYGTAAALVFNKLFFPSFDPLTGTLAAFGTYAVASPPVPSAASCSVISATGSGARPC